MPLQAASPSPGPAYDRREVLARLAALSVLVGLPATAWAAPRPADAPAAGAPAPRGPAPSGARVLTPAEWATFEAVQETLWPAGDGCPGARDVRATAFLDAALGSPDVLPSQAAYLRAHLPTLEAQARARGREAFHALAPADRDAALSAFLDTPDGPAWVRIVLMYTVEAVLGDPVHGINPDGVGWAWAGLEPGDPRPASAGGPR